jgi:psp operon transcriptional activator
MQKRTQTETALKLQEAIGQSERFLEFQERLSRVASVNRPVLLIGERGTGKELAASRLHFLSKRWQGAFIALNCSALSPPLIESELFGHEKGAFTGAERLRIGRFEAANGGTLFLDEIGTIPLEVQEKILRVVEYGTFERVGSSEYIEVDVRIIAATNADLPALVDKGQFKQDLLDRLSFEVLFLPPLRERKGDIPILARHFAAKMAFEMGKDYVPEFREDAALSLETYAWPGNIRELKNLVERAVYRADSPLISEINFDPFGLKGSHPLYSNRERDQEKAKNGLETDLLTKSYDEAVDTLKIYFLKKALMESRFNQKRAAKKMGLTYDQFRGLYRKYKNYCKNLTHPNFLT